MDKVNRKTTHCSFLWSKSFCPPTCTSRAAFAMAHKECQHSKNLFLIFEHTTIDNFISSVTNACVQVNIAYNITTEDLSEPAQYLPP